MWSGLWHKTLVTKGVGVSGTYVVLKFFAVRIYVDVVTRVTDNWILGFLEFKLYQIFWLEFKLYQAVKSSLVETKT